MPTSWLFARGYEHRFSLRADAVMVDAGHLSAVFDDAALLGTVQAAGPQAVRRYENDGQIGLSVGLGYATDSFGADIGTTPLGFLLSNVVGGVEWSPHWRALDVSLGIARRPVTSSVLSYAGLRDPIAGRNWGGVIETGPYVGVGLYRERYGVSASLRASELTGTQVLDNRFVGMRGTADLKVIARPEMSGYAGITLNYWSYAENLQNYTFGSGGYYSPQSYVSVALPFELQGTKSQWSYRLRISLAYSDSKHDRIEFYPNDPDLQAVAALSPLPSGYDAPFFESASGGGFSASAYAAVERRLSPGLVAGAKLDIDRADYYEPTVLMLYVRHTFGSAQTPLAIPPRPVRLYSE
jgi:hypothetical protein